SSELYREIEDGAGKPGAVAADLKRGDCVLDIVADVAQGVYDLQAPAAAVGAYGDHDTLGQLAWRDGPASVGVLRELVVVVGCGVAGTEADRDRSQEQPDRQASQGSNPRGACRIRGDTRCAGSRLRRKSWSRHSGQTSILQREQLQPD